MAKLKELFGQLNRNKRKSPLIFTFHFYSIVNGKWLQNLCLLCLFNFSAHLVPLQYNINLKNKCLVVTAFIEIIGKIDF